MKRRMRSRTPSPLFRFQNNNTDLLFRPRNIASSRSPKSFVFHCKLTFSHRGITVAKEKQKQLQSAVGRRKLQTKNKPESK